MTSRNTYLPVTQFQNVNTSSSPDVMQYCPSSSKDRLVILFLGVSCTASRKTLAGLIDVYDVKDRPGGGGEGGEQVSVGQSNRTDGADLGLTTC